MLETEKLQASNANFGKRQSSDVIFDHLFINLNGEKDSPQIYFDDNSKEFILPESSKNINFKYFLKSLKRRLLYQNAENTINLGNNTI